MNNKKRNLRQK